MNLEKLINSTDLSKPKQVKKLQRALKGQGLYSGPIDGEFGGGTTQAVQQYKKQLQSEKDAESRRLEMQLKARESEAELRKQELEAEKKSPLGTALNFANTAIHVLPFLAGGYGGMRLARWQGEQKLAKLQRNVRQFQQLSKKASKINKKKRLTKPDVAEGKATVNEAYKLGGGGAPYKSPGYKGSKEGQELFEPGALDGTLLPAALIGEGVLSSQVAPQFTENENMQHAFQAAGSMSVGAGLAYKLRHGLDKKNAPRPSAMSLANIETLRNRIDDVPKTAKKGLVSNVLSKFGAGSKAVMPVAGGALLGDMLGQSIGNQAQASDGSETMGSMAARELGAPLGATLPLISKTARTVGSKLLGPVGAALTAKEGYDFMMEPKLGGALEPETKPIKDLDERKLAEYFHNIIQEEEQQEFMTHQ